MPTSMPSVCWILSSNRYSQLQQSGDTQTSQRGREPVGGELKDAMSLLYQSSAVPEVEGQVRNDKQKIGLRESGHVPGTLC